MDASASGSRLEKLLRLLQGGASGYIRKAAASQIAGLAKAYPAQLVALTRKVQALLSSRTWEARVAAGECVGLLAEHAQHHSAEDLCRAAGIDINCADSASNDVQLQTGMLRLQDFDISKVIEQGTVLVSSGGQEYDDDPDDETSPAERLKKQRNNLKARLGLGGQMEQLVDTADLVDDLDLVSTSKSKKASDANKQSATDLLSQMTGLSARERNVLKRKMKQAGKSSGAALKRLKSEGKGTCSSQKREDAEAEEWREIAEGRWPFQRLADQLCVDCLHPAWERRHGAALALREILRSHAAAAAVEAPVIDTPSGWSAAGGRGKMQLGPVSHQAAKAAVHANRIWLEDCLIHLLCVLALDRFGDYVSDQVVAPVRETAAQALGAATRALSARQVLMVARLLRQLTSYPDWAVRHGGLLGIKYLLAARRELAADLLPLALPAALAGLQDADDDVRAVAAEALLPVASAIAAAGASTVEPLRAILWDILLTLEELSPSTGSVMQLLTLLQEGSHGQAGGATKLEAMVPRLWPFFRHTLTSVRLATLRCLTSLLAAASQPAAWLTAPVLAAALRLSLQNLLIESNANVLQASQEVWKQLLASSTPQTLTAALPEAVILGFFNLAATPEGHSLNASLLFHAQLPSKQQQGLGPEVPRLKPIVVGLEDGAYVMRMRFAAADALGLLGAAWLPGVENPVARGLLEQLASPSAAGRLLAGLTSVAWAKLAKNSLTSASLPQQLSASLVPALACAPVSVNPQGGLLFYSELAPFYAHMHQAATRLLNQYAASGWDLNALLNGLPAELYVTQLTVDGARATVAVVPSEEGPEMGPLATIKAVLQAAADSLANAEAFLHSAVTAALAAAIVQAGQLPPKLNAVIQPLMGALRREQSTLLRSAAAVAIAELVALCNSRTPCPNDKIVKNVCGLACGDSAETPDPLLPDLEEAPEMLKATGKGGRTTVQADAPEDPAAEAARLARLGGEAALQSLAGRFGPDLLIHVPKLAQTLAAGLDTAAMPALQATMESLQVLRVTGPSMDASLHPTLLGWLPSLQACLRGQASAVRRLAAKCSAALANVYPDTFLPPLLRLAVPMLGGSEGDAGRQGAVVLVEQLVQLLQERLVPYAFLLVVPLMSRMSDPVRIARVSATTSFAAMVALLPLAQGMEPPAVLDAAQREAWLKDSVFLQQLLDNAKVEQYELPVRINGDLRAYQKDGISWLAFLRRCGLHGVLADDMGLGKTLQATAIIAASHVEARASGAPHKPSLIVCPPVLVGHWPFEMAKFVGLNVLRPMAYEGPPAIRQGLRAALDKHDVVVMSYETLRADINWVEKTAWNYCVLDEGHAIRNPKAKVTLAVKRVVAQHRLILSGTPIQNNVLELWALFDFLMPGFLGSEAAFNARFGKALQSARGSKQGSKEAQAGLLAMEGLHKQVTPFILRRTKDAVLSDLPPKILQDVLCQLSPLQLALYDDFAKSPASEQITGVLSQPAASSVVDTAAQQTPHVFQALQYLRKLCSHPLLVLQPTLPRHVQAVTQATGAPSWEAAQAALHRLEHAPKLAGLQQLLQQCGLGTSQDGSVDSSDLGELQGSEQQEHRVLVFAQLRGLLDLVETDVMQPMGISYVRLDGGVEATQRFGIVQRFNQDPSISVMLLTTSVGGLGLNLTAADTVIFLEHDWNPMKDLQAMDRAHRLGQKRTVNVYRLLMRDSLEERIMGLQRFKLDVASAVINQDNVSLRHMDTGALLDLFSAPGSKPSAAAASGDAAAAAIVEGGAPSKKPGGLKAVLEGLEELWDESQYAEEFSLDAFVSKLGPGT